MVLHRKRIAEWQAKELAEGLIPPEGLKEQTAEKEELAAKIAEIAAGPAPEAVTGIVPAAPAPGTAPLVCPECPKCPECPEPSTA